VTATATVIPSARQLATAGDGVAASEPAAGDPVTGDPAAGDRVAGDTAAGAAAARGARRADGSVVRGITSRPT